jgi:hypothetical protein
MAGLKLNETSAPSTPASGKDEIYMSSETLPRLRRVDSAGTIWPVSDIFIMALSADFTLANSGGAAEKCFNGTTNGAITLPANSAYQFEWQVALTNTGTTSHTWALLFAGTATLTSGMGIGQSWTAAASSNALAAVSQIYSTTLGTALVLTAASTSATEFVTMAYRGVIRINAGGTLIPQIKASAATSGTAKVLANSYIRLTPFGTDTATNLGNWS